MTDPVIEPVLVVGSYPPVATASTRSTLDAVRQAWAEGKSTVVLSPRPGAADLVGRVDGLLGGRALRSAQHATGATELVLCAEPGFPVHPTGGGTLRALDSWLTCAAIARVLPAFTTVTVVENGFSASQIPGWTQIQRRATAIVSHPERTSPTTVSPIPTLADTAQQYRAAGRLVVKRALGPRAPAVARAARQGRSVLRRAAAVRQR